MFAVHDCPLSGLYKREMMMQVLITTVQQHLSVYLLQDVR